MYIADTDLFQRDVTRFLNADLGPIYFVAKQLLRTLPVYFNEVGAEGELRTVSTDVDEIAGRRDSLVHFLRKQLHAESSNRMVDFSRAVLRYWATLDPSGLGPFVSANTMEAVRLEQERPAARTRLCSPGSGGGAGGRRRRRADRGAPRSARRPAGRGPGQAARPAVDAH